MRYLKNAWKGLEENKMNNNDGLVQLGFTLLRAHIWNVQCNKCKKILQVQSPYLPHVCSRCGNTGETREMR